MLFYPYTVFIFTLAHIPASPLFIYLTDKFLSSLVFILLFLIGFPNSLIILFSSIAGNIFWSYDLFHISKFIETPKLPDEENLISSHEQDTITNDLQTLIAMGFDEKLAEQALTASNNDLETAIAILLNGH